MLTLEKLMIVLLVAVLTCKVTLASERSLCRTSMTKQQKQVTLTP